jgi:hypothetical protein
VANWAEFDSTHDNPGHGTEVSAISAFKLLTYSLSLIIEKLDKSLELLGDQFVLLLHLAHLLREDLELLLEVPDAGGLSSRWEDLVGLGQRLLVVSVAHLLLLPIGRIAGIEQLGSAACVARECFDVCCRLLRSIAAFYLLILIIVVLIGGFAALEDRARILFLLLAI